MAEKMVETWEHQMVERKAEPRVGQWAYHLVGKTVGTMVVQRVSTKVVKMVEPWVGPWAAS